MQTITSSLIWGGMRLLLAAAVLIIAPAQGAEYWLRTGTTSIAGVPMWGYALCGTGSTAPSSCAGAVSVPGPALTVAPGEGLIVHLSNTLPVPTSLVIAGQVKQEPMQPVWFEPGAPDTVYNGARPVGNMSARVRSFDREAAAAGGSATYTWASLRPGTYLYSSGTHPQVQVQMGLYGALTKDAGAGKIAYSQGTTNITYANQAILVYSEIDPALHAAVQAGTYGSSGPRSTLDYRPRYFLINGKPFPDASLNPLQVPTLPAGQTAVPAGQNLLLRLVNAGLKTHVPTIDGQYWRVIAEDGNPVPYLGNARQQYTAFMPAGKTVDVLLQPSNPSSTDTVRYAIFDSRHYDTTLGVPGGGMLVKLDVGPGSTTPPVFDSAPSTTALAGNAYQYQAHATASDGHPVQYALANPPVPPAGMTIDGSTGLLSWPAVNVVAGSYPVTVRATDAVAVPALSTDQSFTIVVSAPPTNLRPVARPDSYTAVAHAAANGNQVVLAPGLLVNDTDADGNPLTALKVSECVLGSSGACTTSSNRITLGADGGFTLSSSTSTSSLRLTYSARDNSGDPATNTSTSTATITMVANRAPVAAADTFTVPRCTFRSGTGSSCRTGAGYYQPLTLNVASNDTDPDTQTIDVANQLPLAAARLRVAATGTGAGGTTISTAAGGTASIVDGAVSYVPPYNFAGTDTFRYRVKDKLGKESGSTGSNTNNLGAGWVSVTLTVQ